MTFITVLDAGKGVFGLTTGYTGLNGHGRAGERVGAKPTSCPDVGKAAFEFVGTNGGRYYCWRVWQVVAVDVQKPLPTANLCRFARAGFRAACLADARVLEKANTAIAFLATEKEL